ncbi:MAG: Asp-tRNA(Asn)/Glu-tRNA(Gln) amidotransferase subunit GatA [Verrucomicrobiales bacterium]|jgi:aspartyl-tRNA(Asn)/glutamyl-tRNA(Gln) amidotransferase subunit A|nr:Asp-tRNA(Asn)/Glu-tRNA(Gln) amidotransferase subunit GatA [Verrucomicrobiales bacterium]
MKLHTLTIKALRARLAAKDITPAELVNDLLQRIAAIDPQIHGYLRLNPADALRQAATADISLPLGGIPIAIKDNIAVRGEGCTCASRLLEHYTSPFDATVIRKLKAVGAILLGRANMDEFAMGSSTEYSAFGRTRNPWDFARIPGGSSGGSAAVVAADEAIAALGTDTGGSIRQPAAFCGCVGLKPTYGRVSRYGAVAFASSLDQIGPLTKTVADAALLLNIISGYDELENTSRPVPVPDFTATLSAGIKGLRVGIPKEYFIDGMDAEVLAAVRAAMAWYAANGAELVDISLPNTEHAISVYYIVATAEASANLARFDGVRYGRRSPDGTDAVNTYSKTRAQGFGSEVKRRVILGTYVLSSGYYDAYYHRAQKVRQLLRRDFTEAFKQCDVILTPTSPTPAFKAGEKSDPLSMYLADIFTIAVNLAEVCGISLPCGFTANSLPIGLQLIGPHFGEARLLAAAHAYERAHEWAKRRPGFD